VVPHVALAMHWKIVRLEDRSLAFDLDDAAGSALSIERNTENALQTITPRVNTVLQSTLFLEQNTHIYDALEVSLLLELKTDEQGEMGRLIHRKQW